MKVYQFKYQEMFIFETVVNEERYIEQYHDLFDELLRCKIINKKRIFELINLCNYSISCRPVIIEPMLKKTTLPAFQFLACLN